MWSSIRLKNFMALGDVEVPLGPFNVLVGKSGTGKSSVLRGAELLARVVSPEELGRDPGSLTLSLGGVFAGRWAPRRLARGPGPIELEASVREGTLTVWVEGSSDGVGVHVPVKGGLRSTLVGTSGPLPWQRDLPLREMPWIDDDTPPYAGLAEMLARVHADFTSVAYHHLEVSRMEAASTLDDERGRLSTSGDNLAAQLSLVAAEAPETFAALPEALREIIPNAGKLRVMRERVRRKVKSRIIEGARARDLEVDEETWGWRVELEMKGEGYIPADLLSEGTLLTLGVLTAVLSPNAPRLLLLDDVDRGLHPAAHAGLIGMLNKLQETLAARGRELQIVCTSHSHYVVDACQPEEVLVFGRGEDREVRCRRLSDHPDWDRWRAMMQPGEFWTYVAEGWVAKESA